MESAIAMKDFPNSIVLRRNVSLIARAMEFATTIPETASVKKGGNGKIVLDANAHSDAMIVEFAKMGCADATKDGLERVAN